jgi:hypothetical protein
MAAELAATKSPDFTDFTNCISKVAIIIEIKKISSGRPMNHGLKTGSIK